jgi:hypothetical protein
VAEETQYLSENPHLEQLRRIFEIAKINFGRIDYGCVNGKVQVWEINTNPNLLWPMQNEPAHAARFANHTQFAEQMVDALLQFNAVSQDVKLSTIRISPPPSWFFRKAVEVTKNRLPYQWWVWVERQNRRWRKVQSP